MVSLCFAHLEASSGPRAEVVTNNNQRGRESGLSRLGEGLDKTCHIVQPLWKSEWDASGEVWTNLDDHCVILLCFRLPKGVCFSTLDDLYCYHNVDAEWVNFEPTNKTLRCHRPAVVCTLLRRKSFYLKHIIEIILHKILTTRAQSGIFRVFLIVEVIRRFLE